MTLVSGPTPGRLRRLSEELEEAGLTLDRGDPADELVLIEVDYCLHPRVHERRVPSYGSIVAPSVPPARWPTPTELEVEVRPLQGYASYKARAFADGLSSWLTRTVDGADASIVFDRPAGSERDLVVLAEATGATLVQRHPKGVVRVVGTHGVLRHDGIDWHHEPPVRAWIDTIAVCEGPEHRAVLGQMLAFAVHDLGARGIGATLIHRPVPEPEGAASYELRMPTPPPLKIGRPTDLAPLIHVLSQIDGACVFDEHGRLRELGVRLVPSPEAESDVDGFRGMRHTSARRYSFDDPDATLIVVSEDGPVTVLRKGELVGRRDGEAEAG